MSFLKLLAAVPLLCLVARAPAVGALPPPSSNCQRKCGDVDIPYPFAIGPTDTPDHCGFPGFNVSCNHTGNGTYKPFRGGVELLNISLEDAQCRVMHFLSSSCYNRTAKQMDYSEWQINLSKPYRFSDIRNKFTVIGCRTLAYIDDDNTYTSGCVATCGYGDLKTLANGTCSGIGCCQTSIPVDLKSYSVSFDESMNTSQIYNVTPCSYAVLLDTSSNFSFSTNYLTTTAFNDSYGGGGRAPLVLDWAIRDVNSCWEAKKSIDSYACASSNSKCVDSRNGPGYICHCSPGYKGNPYLGDHNGCQGEFPT